MKKILIFFIISLLFINLISFVSAAKLSGSFTITGEAVEEASENNESGVTEESFLNSIKNFFIYAFTMGGEFEIKAPSDGEEPGEGGGGGGSPVEPITELENKSDNQTIDYNETNKSTEEEIPKEEVPWKIKESQIIFIIIIILIIIVLFLKRKLLKRKLLKLLKTKPKKRKK